MGVPGSSAAIDGTALTAHLEDIVDSDDDVVKVWTTAKTDFSKLPYVLLSLFLFYFYHVRLTSSYLSFTILILRAALTSALEPIHHATR